MGASADAGTSGASVCRDNGGQMTESALREADAAAGIEGCELELNLAEYRALKGGA